MTYQRPRWGGVTIDANDVALVAGFWSGLLGVETHESMPGWSELAPIGEDRLKISVQPVAEPKMSKARVHLDLYVDDLSDALAEVERLGGQVTGERHEYDEGVVHVVADPEGTELCLVWLRPDAEPARPGSDRVSR